MQKILLSTLLLTTTLAAQATPQTCAVPLQSLTIEGLKLDEPVSSFQRRFPQARRHASNSQSGQFDAEPGQLRLSPDVQSVAYINYARGQISAFSLVYDDLETSVAGLARAWTGRYGLPKTGWQRGRQQYVYRCRDYQLTIKQDFGMGRGTMGATLTLQRR